MTYATLILLKKPGAFDDALTYTVPDGISVEVGDLAEAPFRNQIAHGIVLSISETAPVGIDPDKIKPIHHVSQKTILPPNLIETLHFVADHYRTSLTRSLRLFLPKALWNGRPETPFRRFVSLVHDTEPSPRGSKIQKILATLRENPTPLPLEALIELTGGFTQATLRRLVELDRVQIIEEPIYSPFDPHKDPLEEPRHALTATQSKALEALRASDRPSLLFGVTGSGKTELYLHLILDSIRAGKQCILLVPEIALTPQTIDYFRRHLHDRIALQHSKLSDGERLREWWKAKSGHAPLTIGSRSALFAPYDKLGLVIVDEEHEWTYKQESDPHYHARQVAEALAKTSSSKLVLGSATPSAESWQKAESGAYRIVEIPERFHGGAMPTVTLVDLREEFKKRNFGIFSPALVNRLADRLTRKEQSILFVNQRGMANAVVCRDCGLTQKCPRCDIALKYHRSLPKPSAQPRNRATEGDRLVCHYCDFEKAPDLLCPNCRSPHIRHIGVGTQRVEEEVKRLFPSARVARADRDTTDTKAGFEPIYRDFLEGKTDILVGTQMVAKGLDFGNVTLIGIVLADVGLHQPDFRSSERLFQLLTQVSGRCGRGDKAGEVVLQTYNPEHPAIRMASRQDYRSFMEEELRHRKALGYPPFSRLVKFTVVGSDPASLAKHIETEHETLEDIAKTNSLDLRFMSAPASIPRMADRYYYHVLVRAEKPEILFLHWKTPKGWRTDVDPVHTA